MCKKFSILIYFLFYNLCLFSINNLSYGQITNKDLIINPVLTDISEILPPLEVLFDSAYVNVASYKAKAYNVNYQATQITSTQRSWLKYLGLEAYYNYGTAEKVFQDSNKTIHSF